MIYESANSFGVNCARCKLYMPPGHADIIHLEGKQPYFTCPLCTLSCGFQVDPTVEKNLASFPRHDPGWGKEIAPYPYQVDDARVCSRMRSVFLNHQMRVGKTPISALGALRRNLGNLLFVPLNVRNNWEEEIHRWRPGFETVVVSAPRDFFLPEPGEVVIAGITALPGGRCKPCKTKGIDLCTHNDQLRVPMPEINKPMVLLVDEVHKLQNPASERRLKWDRLASAVWRAGGFLYGLTGTAISNSPEDLWNILCLLKLDRCVFPGGRIEFKHYYRQWYETDKGAKNRNPLDRDKGEILKRLRPVRIMRLRKHVQDYLPPVDVKVLPFELKKKHYQQIDQHVHQLLAVKDAWEDVEKGIVPNYLEPGLSPDEKELRKAHYDDRVKYYMESRPVRTDEELKEAIKSALEWGKSLPPIEELSRIRKFLAMAKAEPIKELIQLHESNDEPMIFFSNHVDVLEKLFGGRRGWGIMHGGVKPADREKIWRSFQQGWGEYRYGIAASIEANAEGINLNRAGALCFVDKHWNPAKNRQARDRVNGPGAERHDSITEYHLVANHPVDRLVEITVREKEGLMDTLEDDEVSMRGIRKGKA